MKADLRLMDNHHTISQKIRNIQVACAMVGSKVIDWSPEPTRIRCERMA